MADHIANPLDCIMQHALVRAVAERNHRPGQRRTDKPGDIVGQRVQRHGAWQVCARHETGDEALSRRLGEGFGYAIAGRQQGDELDADQPG
jgi:hypothetical protein